MTLVSRFRAILVPEQKMHAAGATARWHSVHGIVWPGMTPLRMQASRSASVGG